jgi:hypothetical protein
MSLDLSFHGPEVELTRRLRLRLTCRRILHLLHLQRRRYQQGKSYPPGTPFDVVMADILSGPGWQAEPGIGIHIEEGTE